MDRSRKLGVPQVVVWSAALYVVLMISTIVVWVVETRSPHTGGNDLYGAMLDSLKVGLGALIGVLSQWAHQSFGSERERDDDRDKSRRDPDSPSLAA